MTVAPNAGAHTSLPNFVSEAELMRKYVLVKREHWVGVKTAAAVIVVVCGVGVWQLAKESAKGAINSHAVSTTIKSIEELELKARQDGNALAALKAKWANELPAPRLSVLETTLKDKGAKIDALEGKSAEKDAQLTAITVRLATAEARVTDLRAQALQDVEDLADLTSDLNLAVKKINDSLANAEKAKWVKVIADMPGFLGVMMERLKKVRVEYAVAKKPPTG